MAYLKAVKRMNPQLNKGVAASIAGVLALGFSIAGTTASMAVDVESPRAVSASATEENDTSTETAHQVEQEATPAEEAATEPEIETSTEEPAEGKPSENSAQNEDPEAAAEPVAEPKTEVAPQDATAGDSAQSEPVADVADATPPNTSASTSSNTPPKSTREIGSWRFSQVTGSGAETMTSQPVGAVRGGENIDSYNFNHKVDYYNDGFSYSIRDPQGTLVVEEVKEWGADSLKVDLSFMEPFTTYNIRMQSWNAEWEDADNGRINVINYFPDLEGSITGPHGTVNPDAFSTDSWYADEPIEWKVLNEQGEVILEGTTNPGEAVVLPELEGVYPDGTYTLQLSNSPVTPMGQDMSATENIEFQVRTPHVDVNIDQTVNPVEITGMPRYEDSEVTWKIVSTDGAVIHSGNGPSVPQSVLTELPAGDYEVTFTETTAEDLSHETLGTFTIQEIEVPVEPTDPEEPTEPEVPVVPTDPETPTETVDPAPPVDPTDPGASTPSTSTPGTTAKPADPTDFESQAPSSGTLADTVLASSPSNGSARELGTDSTLASDSAQSSSAQELASTGAGSFLGTLAALGSFIGLSGVAAALVGRMNRRKAAQAKADTES